MALKDLKFTTILGIISILGFTAILVQSASGVDIGPWIDSALFLLIGLALVVSGGYHLIFKYFEDGLDVEEINKIVAVVVGIASIFVGLLTFPLLGINITVFDGIKIIISGIAIMVIALEMILKK